MYFCENTEFAKRIGNGSLGLLVTSIMIGILVWLAVAFKISKKVPNFAVARRRSAYFCSTEYYKAFVTILFLYVLSNFFVLLIFDEARGNYELNNKGGYFVKTEDIQNYDQLYAFVNLAGMIRSEGYCPNQDGTKDSNDVNCPSKGDEESETNNQKTISGKANDKEQPLILILAFLGPLTGVCDVKNEKNSI
jgi:hypothetical protein